jgi:hypothetical protein
MSNNPDTMSKVEALTVVVGMLACCALIVFAVVEYRRNSLPAEEGEIRSLISEFPDAQLSVEVILNDRSLAKRDLVLIRREQVKERERRIELIEDARIRDLQKQQLQRSAAVQ